MFLQDKKWLKIALIALAILIVWGLANLYPGSSEVSREYPTELNTMTKADSIWQERAMEEKTITREVAGQPSLEEPGFAPENPIPVQDKKVIKDGNLELKVSETEKAVTEIGALIKTQGGEVFSTNIYERIKGSKRGVMVVKVPVANFEKTMEEIKKVATQVVSESSSGQDVTEQYADLEARLKNKRAEEEAFVKILDRSGEISDVLATTREISRVRGEIEQLEGQMKFLNSQTEMSTISISLSEDVEVPGISDDWRPWQTVKSAFKKLIKKFQGLIEGLISFVIVGIPQLIVIFFFAWIIFWAGKKIWQKARRIF